APAEPAPPVIRQCRAGPPTCAPEEQGVFVRSAGSPGRPARRSTCAPEERQVRDTGEAVRGAGVALLPCQWVGSPPPPARPIKPAFLFRSPAVNERQLRTTPRPGHSGVPFPLPSGKRTPVAHDRSHVPIAVGGR